MGRCISALVLFAAAAICRTAAIAQPGGIPAHAPRTDVFTPVTASLLSPNDPIPVLATDGKFHLDYELALTGAVSTPATLEDVSAVDAESGRVLACYSGETLRNALRAPGLTHRPGTALAIEPGAVRILFLDLALPAGAALPRSIAHRFRLRAQASPAPGNPKPLDYTIAAVRVNPRKPLTLHAPLRGGNWVAINGCCGLGGAHRVAELPVNGRIWIAQRYAIDYMRLDAKGRFFEGDESVPSNYADYGADVLAVADGVVVDTLDSLDDQVPGRLPDPGTLAMETVDGNHVVIDLGGGVYAFFAHLKKGSLTVKRGDRVKAGQAIGKLGNTGNTSAPHLHFHIMAGASVLGSDGLPYAVDRFALQGRVDAQKFASATGVEGDYGGGLAAKPVLERNRFPLDLQIVDFGRR